MILQCFQLGVSLAVPDGAHYWHQFTVVIFRDAVHLILLAHRGLVDKQYNI